MEIQLTSVSPATDCKTGAPGIGKKTQCELLCRKFGFQKLAVNDVLYEKSNDQTYPHSKFLKDCLDEQVDVPKELAIDLLEKEINEGLNEGKKWTLVCGFPESMQELLQFEEKVGLSYVNINPANLR